MQTIHPTRSRLFSLLVFLFLIQYVAGQVMRPAEIDSLAEKTRRTFQVPGIAVAVVQGNRIIHSKGYGLISIAREKKVDSNTLFAIASNSKAFTSAALGILVEEGKLRWNDRVIDFIPEFRLYSPYVTEEFTITDLLTHRSGLGLGAGDLMIWPGGNSFTVEEIIHNLRYLKPVSGFRSKFDYDNLMYLVAGEVVARVSGMTWEDFIEKRIMEPLGMTGSFASHNRIRNTDNVIDPHIPVDGVLKTVDHDFSTTADAAGGIFSNLTDLCKWVMMQMNDGKYGENGEKQLFSKNVHDAMWTPVTMMPARSSAPYNTHFSGYGLGWFLNDVSGYLQVSHTGGLGGVVTQVTLIPEKKLGIIVLTNQQSGAAFSAITNTIKDSYLGVRRTDWVKTYSDAEQKQFQRAKTVTDALWKEIADQRAKSGPEPADSLYAGTYRDPWLGEVTISRKNGKLRFDAAKSPKLTGELMFYRGNTYIVKWDDRTMDADAFAIFSMDQQGKASGMKMKAISPITDFSYDFQDLEFLKKN